MMNKRNLFNPPNFLIIHNMLTSNFSFFGLGASTVTIRPVSTSVMTTLALSSVRFDCSAIFFFLESKVLFSF